MKHSSEKWIETSLRKQVEKQGGLCLKLACLWFTGFPDRTVLLPGGRIYFCELKSTGKKLFGRQKLVRKLLMRMGFQYRVIDTEQLLNLFIDEITVDI